MMADHALWMQQNSLRMIFAQVRRRTLDLVQGLSAEDCMVQSMPEASPVKWHLAHTSWFFETFVLSRVLPKFQPFDPAYHLLFNSYYLGVGEPHARPERGLLSRPSFDEVLEYREKVDAQILALLATPLAQAWLGLIELGINHEEQHQELLLTDIKHHFWSNPVRPVYRAEESPVEAAPDLPEIMNYMGCEGGLVEIGHEGAHFAFDNEAPRHRIWLEPFALATRLVTNSEYLAFMVDGGYGRPELWLADGWELCVREDWHAPLYWFRHDGKWWQFTLSGAWPVRMNEPVCHVSHYEAAAYARWAEARLPMEGEWEYLAARWWNDAQKSDTSAENKTAAREQFLEAENLHPPAGHPGNMQFFGTLWQWMQSAYLPYPGFRSAGGAISEYNGKFMSNQMVLRGGSCVTPRRHMRPTYRNFLAPHSRWQFSGIRLARDQPHPIEIAPEEGTMV